MEEEFKVPLLGCSGVPRRGLRDAGFWKLGREGLSELLWVEENSRSPSAFPFYCDLEVLS